MTSMVCPDESCFRRFAGVVTGKSVEEEVEVGAEADDTEIDIEEFELE